MQFQIQTTFGNIFILQEHILEVDENCTRNFRRIDAWEVQDDSDRTPEFEPVREEEGDTECDSGGVLGILQTSYLPSPRQLLHFSFHRRHLAIKVLYPLLVTFLLVKVFRYFLDILDLRFPALSTLRLHRRLLRKRHVKTKNSFKNGMKRY